MVKRNKSDQALQAAIKDRVESMTPQELADFLKGMMKQPESLKGTKKNRSKICD